MAFKSLTHISKLQYFLTQDYNNTTKSFYVSTDDATEINNFFSAYNNDLIMIITQTPYSDSDSKNIYSAIKIQSINTGTGEIVIQDQLNNTTNYTTSNNAYIAFNLIVDGHNEYDGLDTTYKDDWLWGSTDVTFAELQAYTFNAYA